ncbi:MAG: hypothetical protein KDD40_02835 [Bdellovibrionales bacterium]|nr:hypothetical protein [Bdellovibrionales bacterium]
MRLLIHHLIIFFLLTSLSSQCLAAEKLSNRNENSKHSTSSTNYWSEDSFVKSVFGGGMAVTGCLLGGGITAAAAKNPSLSLGGCGAGSLTMLVFFWNIAIAEGVVNRAEDLPLFDYAVKTSGQEAVDEAIELLVEGEGVKAAAMVLVENVNWTSEDVDIEIINSIDMSLVP